MQNLPHSVRRLLVAFAHGLFCGRQTRICSGRFWIQLVKGKEGVSLLYFDSMMFTVFFCLFSHCFEKIFMTLGRLKMVRQGRNCTW